MMKNEMTLTARENMTDVVLNEIAAQLRRPLTALTSYYNKVLDRPINTKQTLHMVNAQVAFFATLSIDGALLWRVLCIAWLVKAVMGCKKALRTSD